jgi:hypothetical protein
MPPLLPDLIYRPAGGLVNRNRWHECLVRIALLREFFELCIHARTMTSLLDGLGT